MLNRFYRPHQTTLTRRVEGALAARGRALIIDAHSFPGEPLPVEQDRRPERPDICIGTDAVYTPPTPIAALAEACERAGRSAAVDHPYAGTHVPVCH